MNDSRPRTRRSRGAADSPGEQASLQRLATKLGGLAWSPMVWIFLGLFALAEIGNWQMGEEIARVCELLDRGDIVTDPAHLSTAEIDDICRRRSPRDLHKAR